MSKGRAVIIDRAYLKSPGGIELTEFMSTCLKKPQNQNKKTGDDINTLACDLLEQQLPGAFPVQMWPRAEGLRSGCVI